MCRGQPFQPPRSQRRTTHRPPNYHALGRHSVVKAVWEVDRRLADVSGRFDAHTAPVVVKADGLAAVVPAVVDAVGGAPVFAKLSPNATDVVPIAVAAMEAGATGLTCVNTVRAFLVDADARVAALGAGNGGLSGAAIKPIALRIVHDVARALPGVPVIGTGGVSSGVDAAEMLLAGATAVGVGTATFLDPRATLRIRDELVDWCVRRGVARVADLTGALQER